MTLNGPGAVSTNGVIVFIESNILEINMIWFKKAIILIRLLLLVDFTIILFCKGEIIFINL